MKRKNNDIEKLTNGVLQNLNDALKKAKLKPIESKDLKSIRYTLNTLKTGFDMEKVIYPTVFHDHVSRNKREKLFLMLSYQLGFYIKFNRDSITKDLIEFLYKEKTDLGEYKLIKKRGKK